MPARNASRTNGIVGLMAILAMVPARASAADEADEVHRAGDPSHEGEPAPRIEHRAHMDPDDQALEPPSTEAAEHDLEVPPLPDGETLEQVLAEAARGPGPDAVQTIHDDRLYAFWFFDQLEGRGAPNGEAHLGWEDFGWLGGDLDRLWWKNEGEWLPSDGRAGEMETDVLYGRLITPFWTLQAGGRYSNDWSSSGYEDRWSAAVALQGLVPYKVELDASLYFSEDLDLTGEMEAEYGLRMTQRLVVQPRVGLALSAQEVPERELGAGLTSASLDVRMRYEFRRELAPYVGARAAFALGQTAERVQDAGGETREGLLLAGVRVAL